MSHSDEVLKAALLHGTEQVAPNTEAAWRRVNARIGAARLRARVLRVAAAAAAGLVLATVAVPDLRAAAAGLWQDVLKMTQGPASYRVVVSEQPAAPVLPQAPEKLSMVRFFGGVGRMARSLN